MFKKLLKIFEANPDNSPCIGVCEMDPNTGMCEGCLRTMEEISGWSQFSSEKKAQVWQNINRRKKFVK